MPSYELLSRTCMRSRLICKPARASAGRRLALARPPSMLQSRNPAQKHRGMRHMQGIPHHHQNSHARCPAQAHAQGRSCRYLLCGASRRAHASMQLDGTVARGPASRCEPSLSWRCRSACNSATCVASAAASCPCHETGMALTNKSAMPGARACKSHLRNDGA